MASNTFQSASTSLDRAFLILDLVEESSAGLSNAEISRVLGIATSSCSYVLTRLTNRGYLSRDEDGRYRIGLRPLALAHGTLREMGFRSLAEPALYGLVSETGLSASVGVVERGLVLVVDRIESPKLAMDAVDINDNVAAARRIRKRELRDIGRELPLHSNALGKAILAFLPETEARGLIEKHPLVRCTHRTITSRAALMANLELTRQQGYSVSVEEQYDGICGLGAPIFDSSGAVIAAVSLTGSLEESKCEHKEAFARAVQAAARAISVRGRFSRYAFR